jgi:hypothetical protein
VVVFVVGGVSFRESKQVIDAIASFNSPAAALSLPKVVLLSTDVISPEDIIANMLSSVAAASL